MTHQDKLIDEHLDQILKEKFTCEFRNGYITLNGVCLTERYKLFAQAIENFEVRDDDIWVCSFPKTGTTWTQEMIWCIGNNLDFHSAKIPLPQRFPFLEHSILFDFSTLMSRVPNLREHELTLDSVHYTETLLSPRYIKTHLPFQLLPRQIKTGEKKPRIIYVTRNPKDTCISYFYHCKLIEAYRGDFEEFCSLFLKGKLCFAPFWEHVLDFWTKRNNSNVLFLKYENMKNDLPSVIKKAASFLGKTIMTEDQIETLTSHLSFANMKSNPAVNYEEYLEINRKFKIIDVEGNFIRSGEVDQWKKEMPPNIVIEFDALTAEKLENVGCKL